ncbi:hypothetical protein [Pectobacterium aquaticum]|uniref:hypothetical protein n=1 Tax=Pectobacterium aquaticum TaxID=2204145 RepID=UPI000E268B20|nr:hypothetical protein [Pectobacterium aquaticum]MCH5050191.1 hypothetical protein [Pectobacterium aquaticum]RRN98207.1 hypothetical protein DMB79_004430 [Pectobacterium aquaticum]UEM38971.1 hypothetical protein DMB82_0017820 [Pectobacterium aquaticum]
MWTVKKRATAQSGVHYEFLIVLWQGLKSTFYDRKKNFTIKAKTRRHFYEASPRRTLRSSSEKQKDGKYAHLRPQLADVMHGF